MLGSIILFTINLFCFVIGPAGKTVLQFCESLMQSFMGRWLTVCKTRIKVSRGNVLPSRHLLRIVSRLSRIPLSFAGPFGLLVSLAPRYIISRPPLAEPSAFSFPTALRHLPRCQVNLNSLSARIHANLERGLRKTGELTGIHRKRAIDDRACRGFYVLSFGRSEKRRAQKPYAISCRDN